MGKNKKNPLLAGLLNMLVPGFIHIYVGKKWLKVSIDIYRHGTCAGNCYLVGVFPSK